MKKNLAISITMLLLAILTCVGVSFAYFSSSLGGGENSVEIGKFVFTCASDIQTVQKLDFKAPTVLNVPKISRPSADESDYEQKKQVYLQHGDDINFNDYCVPFKVTVTNTSMTDMKIKIAASAVPGSDQALNPNYGANGGFQFFVFDSVQAALLAAGGTKAGLYAEAIREISAPETEAADPSLIFENTKGYIADGNEKSALSMATDIDNILLAASFDGEGNVTYRSKEFLVVLWLDWRGFSGALEQARPDGTLDVKINVQASQYL